MPVCFQAKLGSVSPDGDRAKAVFNIYAALHGDRDGAGDIGSVFHLRESERAAGNGLGIRCDAVGCSVVGPAKFADDVQAAVIRGQFGTVCHRNAARAGQRILRFQRFFRNEASAVGNGLGGHIRVGIDANFQGFRGFQRAADFNIVLGVHTVFALGDAGVENDAAGDAAGFAGRALEILRAHRNGAFRNHGRVLHIRVCFHVAVGRQLRGVYVGESQFHSLLHGRCCRAFVIRPHGYIARGIHIGGGNTGRDRLAAAALSDTRVRVGFRDFDNRYCTGVFRL